MLSRTSPMPTDATAPSMPAGLEWDALRNDLSAGTLAWLLQFLVVLVLVCAATCVYLWQTSTISDSTTQVRDMQVELRDLERSNVTLMLQVAQWNSPPYIEQEARKQGMAPGQVPQFVQVPFEIDPTAASQPETSMQAAVLERITSRLSDLAQSLGQPGTLGLAVRLP
jgi:cell division protein FtsL